MNGETQHYDDDRLLAFALGLEDDPGLEAALVDDPALRARLDAMRADVGTMAAGLDRVVPVPPDDYADLSDPRWSELRDLVAAPAPAAPRRRPTWLRVLAPAAAIALVLVAGVVGVQQLGTTVGDQAATVAEDEKAVESSDREDGALSGAVPGAEGVDGADGRSLYQDAGLDPAAFQTIVVGRALPPTADRQRFEVLRVLQGATGDFVSLVVTNRTLPQDTFVLLYLRPLVRAPHDATTPSPRPSATGADASAGLLTYEFRAMPALAQPLPGDVDVDAIALP